MFRQALKILGILASMWIVSLLTIASEFRPGNKILNNKKLYDRALADFRNKYWNEDRTKGFSGSAFEVWKLLEPANITLVGDKLSAITSYDIPPGKMGRPVLLNEQLRSILKLQVKKGWQDHAFNQFVSDIIPLNRSLPDVRDDWCKNQTYSTNLPVASVVICFYNEAWSTLLRTVHSVLNRSPDHLLKEIILFDDFSIMEHLGKKLEDYIKSLPKVKLIRATRREGLIRARMMAIRDITSPVIVFLDSHCECAEGWLEPLLDRIALNSSTVVSPIVDEIQDTTFEYISQDSNDLRIGGFNWQLKFKWRGIPANILVNRTNLAAPIQTPTISGGLFAISKEFFTHLGLYDDGFEIWGAENLELSFKVWMCGGSLEMVPCSHVGHVFRKRRPYSGPSGSLKRNTVRLAEVWMDDYAKYYYETIGNATVDYGNVSSRVELRKQLKCKPFQWYLENVYPQLELPDNYVASGQIYSESHFGVCFDSKAQTMEVNLLPCHRQGGNQYWIYTNDGEIKKDDMCLDNVFSVPSLFLCGGRVSSQIWIYDAKTKHIRHLESQKCLQVVRYKEGLKLILKNCSTASTQLWIMENFLVDRLKPELQVYAKRH